MAKVTLQDVADAVGVSRMTVSNAFNRPHKLSESLRATILETATELGYGGPDPSARALARGRSGTVGLLLTDTLGEAFRDPVSTEFLVAVGDALAERSLALTLVATAGDKPPLGQDLPMDGAIVYVCDPRVDLDWLRHRGTPVVTVDQSPTKGVPAVNVDDAGGARAGAEHLLGLGHRRIGVITVGQDLDGRIRPAGQRWAGWRKALAAAGVEPVVAHAGPRPDTAAYDAAKELLDRPGPPHRPALLLRRLRRARHPGRRGPRPARARGPVRRRLRRRRLRLDLPPRTHHDPPGRRREGPRRRHRADRAHRRQGAQGQNGPAHGAGRPRLDRRRAAVRLGLAAGLDPTPRSGATRRAARGARGRRRRARAPARHREAPRRPRARSHAPGAAGAPGSCRGAGS